ncbi:MAG: hypothetical protein II295_00415 [Akkermansia sp.]|nr:hypothetical protein [Akkermansia sp.]
MPEPDFSNLPTRLGVYTLTELLGRHTVSDLYLGKQSHVERGVVVQVLRPGSEKKDVDFFLRAVRAKSATELPNVSQVLESMMSGNIWFLTHEQPKGRSLAQMTRDGVRLSSSQVCRIISAAAHVFTAAEEKNIATGPLRADSIFVHGEESVSFLSPVLPGEHSPEGQVEQMVTLADALTPVLPQNVPGQTRVSTLVKWIREGFEGEYLDWPSAGATADSIKTQITPLLSRSSVEHMNSRTVALKVENKRAQRRKRRALITAAVSALVVLCLGGLGYALAPDHGESLPAYEGGYVYGREASGNGDTLRVQYRLVSIRDYQKFLVVYDDIVNTGPARRSAINKGVPADCADHTPAEWSAQVQAAANGTEWQGEVLSASSPVRGVSYWDALAYANFVKGRLVSAPLLEAVRYEVADERVPEEWTTTQVPASSVYAAGYVVLPPAGSPIVEPAPTARRVSRGFRVAFPVSTQSD